MKMIKTGFCFLLGAPILALAVFAQEADPEQANTLALYLQALWMIILVMGVIFLALLLTRKIGDRWGNREAAAKSEAEKNTPREPEE